MIREIRINETATEILFDTVLVTQISAAMTSKLAESRARGRFGWWSEKIYPSTALKRIIRDHLDRDDILDVAILASMLWVKENVLSPTDKLPRIPER